MKYFTSYAFSAFNPLTVITTKRSNVQQGMDRKNKPCMMLRGWNTYCLLI